MGEQGTTTGISRRQLIQRGAVVSTAIWVPPLVQSIRLPAAAVGSPPPCVVDTGFMTGAGYAYISGASGPKVHYVTQGQLNCVPDGSEKFDVDWEIVTGKGNSKVVTKYSFQLASITTLSCVVNPGYPIGPDANFNETAGTGIGTLYINNVAQPGTASIAFNLIDGGEPSEGNDHVTITIFYPGNTVFLDVQNQPLTQGNIQTHGNTAFGNACEPATV
jgi:hypothetical protein